MQSYVKLNKKYTHIPKKKLSNHINVLAHTSAVAMSLMIKLGYELLFLFVYLFFIRIKEHMSSVLS